MFVASRIIQTRLNLLTVQTQIFGVSKLPYKTNQISISRFQNNEYFRATKMLRWNHENVWLLPYALKVSWKITTMKNPSKMKANLTSRCAFFEFSSWGSTSKVVIYRNVPQAIPEIIKNDDKTILWEVVAK